MWFAAGLRSILGRDRRAAASGQGDGSTTVGVDVGIENLDKVCSDGTVVTEARVLARPLPEKSDDKAIARSRKAHGSQRPFQPPGAAVRQAGRRLHARIVWGQERPAFGTPRAGGCLSARR